MTSQLPLRDYQRDALDAVYDAWHRGVQRPAVVAPTGAGKTVMFAHLIRDTLERNARATLDDGRRYAVRALVLVHRDELADQAMDKIRQVAPDLRVGKVKAGDNQLDADVVVASVQTLAVQSRMDTLMASQFLGGRYSAPFGLVVVDECHHVVAPSWRAVMDMLGCFGGSWTDDFDNVHPVDVVGFSATLARSDGVGLGAVWQEVAYAISLTRLIRRGHLADVRGRQITVEDLDLANVKRSGGDYQAGALGSALVASNAHEVIAAAYREHAADRQGVVFLPTVDTAIATSVALNDAGIAAEVVTGATPREERQLIYKRYREGETQVLANCMVLTEGFDAPWASCAVIARPTQSAPLFTQMVGRVLRPWPGKKDALVLDVVGVAGRLKLATLIDLAPGKITAIADGQSLAEAEEEAELAAAEDRAAMEREIEQSRISHKIVNLFEQSRSVWLRTKAGVWFIPTRSGEFFLWPSQEPGRWDVCQASMDGYKRLPWERRYVDMDIEMAMAWAQTLAEETDPSVATKDASWRRSGKASEAQLGMLTRFYRPDEIPEKLRKSEASDMISVGVASRVFDKHYTRLGK